MTNPDLTDEVREILKAASSTEAPADPTALAVSAIARLLDFSPDDAAILADIITKIRASAEPQMALNNLQRFLEATQNPAVVQSAFRRTPETATILIALMSGSQFLSDVLISQPDAFSWLIDDNTLRATRDPDYYRHRAAEALKGTSSRTEQQAALSRWRRREYLRIGCRDLLLLADAEDVSRDISDLAEAIIDQAAHVVFDKLTARFGLPVPEASSWQDRPVPPPANLSSAEGFEFSTGMCVLGMGKLGGRELNFSSDIDLVFVYEAEGQTTGRDDGNRRVAVITNHHFFTRMGEALVKFLGERGPAGNLFRVDMRLRPEGSDGPLVRSLESFLHYLNSQGRDWERIAYLKARVVSGPARLAEKLYRSMADFVFAGLNAGRIVDEVQSLKIRIDREVINSDLYHREVKRGYGGIREIEFVIAAMQVIHGYQNHALRVRNTFLAVQRLRETHIITAEAAAFYQQAYSFLRMVEHRLQMAQEAQTHTLPLPGPEFEAMARRCGFDSGDQFQREYETITKAVHKRFSEFFQHDTDAVEQAARDILVILDRDAAPEEAQQALHRRGIDAPDALRLIHALAYGTRDVFISAEGQRYFEQMLPAVLRLTAAAPFPGQVFSNLHSFALAMKGITYYYEVIAQHPEILKLLVTLFGTSEPLSALLVAHPEFFDALISSRVLDELDAHGEARRSRINTVMSVRSPGRRLVMLRNAVNFERLVVALKYLLRLEPLPSGLRRLSDTADDAITLAAHLAALRLIGKWKNLDRPSDDEARNLAELVAGNMAVVALGKYGGQELNFFGDLDVVFVYNSSGTLPEAVQPYCAGEQEFYDAFADTLTTVLTENMKGGRVFVLDARLRPHGKSSPLTTEQSAYMDYLETQADTWELQAFHRGRCVWGNSDILPPLKTVAEASAVCIPHDKLVEDIQTMRMRLEESVAPHSDRLEVKRSPGGLTDIEFLIQFLVLSGRLSWDVANANYFYAVEKLPGSIFEQEDKRVLADSYQFLRQVETTIRLVSGGSESVLPSDSEKADGVAAALGLCSFAGLQSSVDNTMRQVRLIYGRYLGKDKKNPQP